MADKTPGRGAEDGVRADLLERALAGGGVGTWQIDLIAGTVSLDAQDAALLGFEPRARTISTQAFADMIHPEDRERVEGEYLQAREHGAQYELECRFFRADGEVCWLVGRGIFLIEDGETVGMAGVHVDMSEYHRVQDELRESQRRLATLMSNLPGLAYRCKNEPEWPMLFVSEGVESLCGYTAEQLRAGNPTWNSLILDEDRPWLWERVQEAVRERCPFKVEYRIRHADGSLLWMWEQGCGVFENGDLVALEGFITDVTARKLAEAELRAADEKKDRFLALLGHELRNPVTAIISASEYLERAERRDAGLERIQGVLARQSRQMKQLIDSLLDVSRIARGKVRLEKKPLELKQLLRGLLEDRAAPLATRHLEVSLGPHEEECWVDADPVRLSQVFENLLMNAVKFTEEADTISLEIEREGDEVGVVVRDTGAGIEAEVLCEIFEPFRQAEHELAGSGDGLGLGLALVRGLVELHGGRVEAQSGGRGCGAEFRVHLPLVEPPDEEGDDEPRRSKERRDILLVEDDPDIGEVVTLLLDRIGHDTRVTHSVSEGLAAVAERRPDLVMCDLGLPGKSGYEFAQAVRADDALADLPLVALTGFGSADARHRALEAGFDDFLTKPVGMAELADVCARLC